MRNTFTFIILFLGLGALSAQNAANVFSLEYDGEPAFASQSIESRYLGEYIHEKGKTEYQFFIKIDAEESYLLKKSDKATDWDLNGRIEIDWAFLSDASGKPLVYKMQEYADGEMQSFPAMVFLYRERGTEKYSTKMLSLRNGNLFLDDAPKQNSVAAQ